jgi:hypothetical protein
LAPTYYLSAADPRWFSDSLYLQTVCTRLVCFVIVASLHGSLLLLVGPCAARRWCAPTRWLVTLGVLREPDAEFGRTWALGAAAIDGDTAITAGARSPPRRPRKPPPRAAHFAWERRPQGPSEGSRDERSLCSKMSGCATQNHIRQNETYELFRHINSVPNV